MFFCNSNYICMVWIILPFFIRQKLTSLIAVYSVIRWVLHMQRTIIVILKFYSFFLSYSLVVTLTTSDFVTWSIFFHKPSFKGLTKQHTCIFNNLKTESRLLFSKSQLSSKSASISGGLISCFHTYTSSPLLARYSPDGPYMWTTCPDIGPSEKRLVI